MALNKFFEIKAACAAVKRLPGWRALVFLPYECGKCAADLARNATKPDPPLLQSIKGKNLR
jgi:hypothetical protein